MLGQVSLLTFSRTVSGTHAVCTSPGFFQSATRRTFGLDGSHIAVIHMSPFVCHLTLFSTIISHLTFTTLGSTWAITSPAHFPSKHIDSCPEVNPLFSRYRYKSTMLLWYMCMLTDHCLLCRLIQLLSKIFYVKYKENL